MNSDEEDDKIIDCEYEHQETILEISRELKHDFEEYAKGRYLPLLEYLNYDDLFQFIMYVDSNY